MSNEQTFGKYLLNRYLPEKYQITEPIEKKELNKRMNMFAREDKHAYVKAITKLKKTGDKFATLEGLSVGLDDIEPEYRKRDAILAPYIQSFKKATNDQQRSQIAEKAQEKILTITLEHPGTLTQQIKSGARGNATQYSKIISSPVNARDSYGNTMPWLINRSYSEGLTPADYWVAGNEAIMDTIKSSTSVSEPGELSKILINNMEDLVVSESDCGTTNGISKRVSSSNISDRYLARTAGPYKAGTLITPQIQSQLMKLKIDKIIVRSPMTCESHDGVCQHCQGLNEKGDIHEIGTNVGVRAAQAMSEPLTQFALNAKHGVRTAASERTKLQGVLGFRQIIESPRQFINKATLAEQNGTITKVEKAPQGGHYIYVNDQQHYVSPHLNVLKTKGEIVESGDVLSEGIPKPDEVIKHKGLAFGRLYVVNALKNLYRDQGYDLDQRHFELVGKGQLNHVRIIDDPSRTFVKGDIVSYNNLKKELAAKSKEMDLQDALGETLGKEYLQFSAGTRVTPAIMKTLKKEKIDQVYIAPRAPEVEFVMKPATRAPLFNPDWLARLAHRNLKVTLEQGAHFGDIANLHSYHPVPAYAYGIEFGEGEKGRY